MGVTQGCPSFASLLPHPLSAPQAEAGDSSRDGSWQRGCSWRLELCLGSPCSLSDTQPCPGGENDPAAREPQVPVTLQEEVCDPPGQAEGPGQHSPAQPVPHPHQWRGPLHQVSAQGCSLPGSTQGCQIQVRYLLVGTAARSPTDLCLGGSVSRCIQINTDAALLNSEFCFILKVMLVAEHPQGCLGALLPLWAALTPLSSRCPLRAQTTRALSTPGWVGQLTLMRPSWLRTS